MLSLVNKKITFDINFCQQCGACSAVCKSNAISYVDLDNGTKNVIVDKYKCVCCKRCLTVCPANRNLDKADYFASVKQASFFISYNTDEKIRHCCSSGGVGKTLIIESLKNNLVDGVYSLKKLDTYPSAKGEFYTKDNIPDYDDIPNSVYHSIMACSELDKVKKVKSLMIVGTSCQLYAMERALKGKYDVLYKICIFCKQQKTFKSTEWLAKMMGKNIPSNRLISVSYRGSGWPGIVKIMKSDLKWNLAAALPFGRRLWCVPGCNICGDSFGIEVKADLSLMDPWNIRKPNDLGETLVLIHTEHGRELISKISSLVVCELPYNEVKPALGIADVWRKRKLVPYFKGELIPDNIKHAGDAEVRQRKYIENILTKMPRIPFLFYRILNKIIPCYRDRILKFTK